MNALKPCLCGMSWGEYSRLALPRQLTARCGAGRDKPHWATTFAFQALAGLLSRQGEILTGPACV